MTNLIGHEAIQERFRRAIVGNRLASTFLFVGPAGVGKFTFAVELAKALLCQNRESDSADACGHCPSCVQVAGKSHPDLIVVKKRADKNRLLIEQFVGDKEKRGREGLCHDISLKSFSGGRKIAIIDDADFLNQESANALLKTLEEPPAESVIILIGTSEQKQLPTIRSRCQMIRFDSLQAKQIEQILTEQNLLPESEDREAIAACSGGSIEMAQLIGDAETTEFRRQWLSQLGSADPFANQFSKTVSGFVDAGGKDAALRRDRLRLVAEFAIQFYQAMLATSVGDAHPLDRDLEKAIQSALQLRNWEPVQIADSLERCFAVQNQIHANANQATIIESWLIDLGRLARHELIG